MRTDNGSLHMYPRGTKGIQQLCGYQAVTVRGGQLLPGMGCLFMRLQVVNRAVRTMEARRGRTRPPHLLSAQQDTFDELDLVPHFEDHIQLNQL